MIKIKANTKPGVFSSKGFPLPFTQEKRAEAMIWTGQFEHVCVLQWEDGQAAVWPWFSFWWLLPGQKPWGIIFIFFLSFPGLFGAWCSNLLGTECAELFLWWCIQRWQKLQKVFVSAVDASDCTFCLGFSWSAKLSCRPLLGKYSYGLRMTGVL